MNCKYTAVYSVLRGSIDTIYSNISSKYVKYVIIVVHIIGKLMYTYRLLNYKISIPVHIIRTETKLLALLGKGEGALELSKRWSLRRH